MSFKAMKGEIIPSLKLQFGKDILCCKYSPNKQYIIGGFTDGTIGVFESISGKFCQNLRRGSLINSEIPVTSLHFKERVSKSNSSTLLATYTDGKVRLWNFETGALIKELVENRQTLGAMYHPKLAKFITFGDNSAIYLYDEETMKLEHTYEKGMVPMKVDGHSSRVFAAVFHPLHTTEFVSGGWDSVVHFWDMRQSNSLRYINGVHICGEGLDISRSGREILTCSYSRDKALQLWHYQTGRLLSNIQPDMHKSMLYCGQWMAPDYILVGGTDPSLIRIVSLKTLTTMLSFKGATSGVYSIDHFLKTGRSKRETSLDFKIIFSIDKMILESDILL